MILGVQPEPIRDAGITRVARDESRGDRRGSRRSGWHATLIASCLFTLLACSSPTESKTARFDQPFMLSPGAAAVFDDNLQVGFDQVLSDSRCPRGAQCIVAGEAGVRVWLSKASRGREDRQLKTTTTASQATYDSYTITLVTLDPVPEAGSTIKPTDYVATLTVSHSP